jgi:hypothetical protein
LLRGVEGVSEVVQSIKGRKKNKKTSEAFSQGKKIGT